MMVAETGSFDPKSWVSDTPASPGVRAVVETAPSVSPAPPAGLPSRRMLAALAASGAILIVGGTSAYLSRSAPAGPGSAAPAATSAATTVAHIEPPPLSRRTLVLAGPEQLNAAIVQAGIVPSDAAAAATAATRVLNGRTGELHAAMMLDTRTQTPQLVRLDVSFEDSSGAIVSRGADGLLTATAVKASLHSRLTVRSGQMDSDSFYSSAVAAGVTDSLVPAIVKALAFDFDFQQEIHPGNVFEVAFEQQVNAAGNSVGVPQLRFISLTTETKLRALYWFQPPGGGEGGWFDGNGASVARSLMRTPVDGARITSKFGMRDHPIYFVAKMHRGVDFGAAIGTPIYASGDGRIEIASPSASAGNWIWLRHDNGWQTVYMHTDHYLPGIVVGKRMRQGEQIGVVGTTGHSTGPHLHYEVHINGEPVDPLSIQTDSTHILTGAERAAFIKERDRIDVSRARQAG